MTRWLLAGAATAVALALGVLAGVLAGVGLTYRYLVDNDDDPFDVTPRPREDAAP